jgi:hypothetical protein
MNRITASILIAIAFTLALAVPVMAQEGCITIGPVPGGIILWCPEQPGEVTPTPEPTVAPTATATNTPLPEATATPQPTATAIPPTATPAPTPTMAHVHPTATPGPGASWQCTAHDKNTWHPHYDSGRNCWYDHEHGVNPTAISYRFGELWSFLRNYPGYRADAPDWKLGSISYPWLTGDGMEQSMKHGGYTWQTFDVAPQNGVLRVQDIGGTFNWVTNGPYWGRITAARFQEHFGSAFADPTGSMPPMFDAHTRFHSFWMEVTVNGGGKIGGGGHWDTGGLWEYFGRIFTTPDDPSPFNPGHKNGVLRDPYRAESRLCEELVGQPSVGATSLWTSRPSWIPDDFGNRWYGWNNHMGLFTVHKDPSVCVTRGGELQFRCGSTWNPDAPCTQNNTDAGPFRLWAYVSPAWDGSALDRDPRAGWVTIYTFTDTRGLPAPTCTAPGANCVPYYVENVRAGWYVWQTHIDDQAAILSVDSDQSPPGKNYINLWGN